MLVDRDAIQKERQRGVELRFADQVAARQQLELARVGRANVGRKRRIEIRAERLPDGVKREERLGTRMEL